MTLRASGVAGAFRIIHAAMTLGLAAAGVTFVVVLRLVRGPVLAGQPTIGVGLAALGIALLVVAAVVLRPRLPERATGQTVEAYWMAADIRGSAIVLWAMVEGGGLVALAGYLLFGRLFNVAVGALAVTTLVLFRPSRLEGEGAV
jgi:hypothetical protein